MSKKHAYAKTVRESLNAERSNREYGRLTKKKLVSGATDSNSATDIDRYRMGYIPANVTFSPAIDISDPGRFVVIDAVSERELRDAYIEWCMRRHGSQMVVAALIGVSTKSIYNHIKRFNGQGG